MEEKINAINQLMEQIINDRTVPRNIRNAVQEAKDNFNDTSLGDLEVRISAAVSILDEIINDPNMPMYTRTQVWNVVSLLESLRAKKK
ncbi:MAG: UPF0147 family protein [Candidatus Aenigmarchaeota archaeon]|nr:UPF0147 family protein [Candidatus Aenigmarchaeota archaeon]